MIGSKLSIAIIDYGVGNTQSVKNAIGFLNYKRVKITSKPSEIQEADVLILPGVGAFETAMKNVKESGVYELLNEEVLVKKKPILGICVGMQMLASGSEENGWHDGLNWIPGKVVKFELPKEFQVPHVGWNSVVKPQNSLCFARNNENPNFYFDHSYHFIPEHKEHTIATTDYGIQVTSAVQNENIVGVQFHPEKSQVSGLKFFRGFFNSIQ